MVCQFGQKIVQNFKAGSSKVVGLNPLTILVNNWLVRVELMSLHLSGK